ncbi:MAG TPA: FAD-dependent monooxygenase [Myxococcota bacterium]
MVAGSSTKDADVVVVGGGLAGAASAIGLRRAGARVIVVDKADFPRDKPCGEGLLPHGVELLGHLGCGDVVDACGGQPFRGILYHCHGVVARGDFENDGRGRGVRRRHLDTAIRDRARVAGADLVTGAVAGIVVDAAGATVTLSDGTSLRSAVVVGADGPRSTTRHALGLDGGAPRSPRYALRQHFRLAPGVALPERVEVHVGEHHELYVTPVEASGDGNVVGVAALCEKRLMSAGDGKPAARLSSLIAACAPLRERLAGAEPVGPAMACGPLRVKSTAVWRGRGVLVGDAAGYVDAITGEGMSLALKTAALATTAITRVLAGDDVDAAFAGYARGRAGVFRDHAILTFGLVELARRPFFAKRVIARLARDPALFSRLLAVNNGTTPLVRFGVGNLLKLAVGATPRPALHG